jgi:hypothetical protein
MVRLHSRKTRGALIAIVIILLVFAGLLVVADPSDKDLQIGATFSETYAKSFGLDEREVYLAALDDLDIQHIRLPIYWNEIETGRDEYFFDDLDWYFDEAEKRDVSITPVVGQKVPRWPECYHPDWSIELSDEDFEKEILEFIEIVVMRYKDRPSLKRWQVENEVFFPFGECPHLIKSLEGDERRLIESLDAQTPIQLTVSGEQSLYLFRALNADVLGASMYRHAKTAAGAEIIFPHPPIFYRLQSMLSSLVGTRAIISELQMEPWGLHMYLENDDYRAAYNSFNTADMQEQFSFAKRTGMPEIYLWGIEWWYELKMKGNDALWETGRQIINSPQVN